MATKKKRKRKAVMPFHASRMLRETMLLVLQDEKRQPIYDLLHATAKEHGVALPMLDNLARVADWMNGAIGKTARVPHVVLDLCNKLRARHNLPTWSDAEITGAVKHDDMLHEAGNRIVHANNRKRPTKAPKAQLALIFGRMPQHEPPPKPKRQRKAPALATVPPAPDLGRLAGLDALSGLKLC